MRATWALLMMASMAVPVLAGCLAPQDPGDESTLPTVTGRLAPAPVQERVNLPFNVSGDWSQVLVAGAFEVLPVESVFVDVALPVDELGGAPAGGTRVHMGLWLPKVSNGTRVPVIADVGPYYNDGDVEATKPANRLGRFLIENFVPHGYAVAQVSVFGTGQSNHCMDLMGRSEQAGIDAAVTWLGEQDWSNGRVGLIGRSYDGSTPWEAATFGNPHLATIVPISGLIGMHELMWRNGSAEARGPIMHNVVYGAFGLDQDAEDAQNLCRDYLAGPAEGAAAYATGDHVAPEANDYWKERYFLERALENYNGSVYFIHGLQDWNVDNHMAFPTYHRLEAAGLEVKGLFGQWAHMYPDRPQEHKSLPPGRGQEAFPDSVRFDWAQDLLEWFDHYLMGTGPRPQLHAEVQDNQGQWRIEPTYPPLDARWVPLGLGTDLEARTSSNLVGPGQTPLVFASKPMGNETRIAGLVRLHVTVTPTGPGGQIYALLEDAETDTHLGHAIMDLRYAQGGTQMQPVTPGMPLLARMEFFAVDVLVPAGHSLRLTLRNTGEDYLPSAVSSPLMVETGQNSNLVVPLVERGPDVFFQPPQWGEKAVAGEQQP